MNSSKAEKYLSARDAAALVNLSEKTLANMRSQQRGPAYIKLGGRVLYPADLLYEWIEANSVLHGRADQAAALRMERQRAAASHRRRRRSRGLNAGRTPSV